MTAIKIETVGQAGEFLAQLGDTVRPELSKSLNVAARGVKTDVTRQLRKTRKMKKEQMDDWRVYPANLEDLEAFSRIRGSRIGLEEFSPAPAGLMKGKTSGGVTVDFGNKKVRFRHAFMSRIYGKKELKLWERVWEQGKDGRLKGKSRLGKYLKGRFPVSHLMRVSVPQMADDDDVTEIVFEKAGERFLKQFSHLINRLVEEQS